MKKIILLICLFFIYACSKSKIKNPIENNSESTVEKKSASMIFKKRPLAFKKSMGLLKNDLDEKVKDKVKFSLPQVRLYKKNKRLHLKRGHHPLYYPSNTGEGLRYDPMPFAEQESLYLKASNFKPNSKLKIYITRPHSRSGNMQNFKTEILTTRKDSYFTKGDGSSDTFIFLSKFRGYDFRKYWPGTGGCGRMRFHVEDESLNYAYTEYFIVQPSVYVKDTSNGTPFMNQGSRLEIKLRCFPPKTPVRINIPNYQNDEAIVFNAVTDSNGALIVHKRVTRDAKLGSYNLSVIYSSETLHPIETRSNTYFVQKKPATQDVALMMLEITQGLQSLSGERVDIIDGIRKQVSNLQEEAQIPLIREKETWVRAYVELNKGTLRKKVTAIIHATSNGKRLEQPRDSGQTWYGLPVCEDMPLEKILKEKKNNRTQSERLMITAAECSTIADNLPDSPLASMFGSDLKNHYLSNLQATSLGKKLTWEHSRGNVKKSFLFKIPGDLTKRGKITFVVELKVLDTDQTDYTNDRLEKTVEFVKTMPLYMAFFPIDQEGGDIHFRYDELDYRILHGFVEQMPLAFRDLKIYRKKKFIRSWHNLWGVNSLDTGGGLGRSLALMQIAEYAREHKPVNFLGSSKASRVLYYGLMNKPNSKSGGVSIPGYPLRSEFFSGVYELASKESDGENSVLDIVEATTSIPGNPSAAETGALITDLLYSDRRDLNVDVAIGRWAWTFDGSINNTGTKKPRGSSLLLHEYGHVLGFPHRSPPNKTIGWPETKGYINPKHKISPIQCEGEDKRECYKGTYGLYTGKYRIATKYINDGFVKEEDKFRQLYRPIKYDTSGIMTYDSNRYMSDYQYIRTHKLMNTCILARIDGELNSFYVTRNDDSDYQSRLRREMFEMFNDGTCRYIYSADFRKLVRNPNHPANKFYSDNEVELNRVQDRYAYPEYPETPIAVGTKRSSLTAENEDNKKTRFLVMAELGANNKIGKVFYKKTNKGFNINNKFKIVKSSKFKIRAMGNNHHELTKNTTNIISLGQKRFLVKELNSEKNLDSIKFFKANKLVKTKKFSLKSPSLKALQIKRLKKKIKLSWKQSHVDGDALVTTIHYRPSDKHPWDFIRKIDREFKDGLIIDNDELKGSKYGQFKITLTNGIKSISKISKKFFTPNHAPYIAFGYSNKGPIEVEAHQFVKINIKVNDVEDGELTKWSLRWHSDLQGTISFGEQLESRLSIGTHKVTLIATDRDHNQIKKVYDVKVKHPYHN